MAVGCGIGLSTNISRPICAGVRRPVDPRLIVAVALPHATCGEDLDLGADDADPGFALEQLELPFQPRRQGDVVGIHAGDIAAAGVAGGEIEGADDTAPRVAIALETGVAAGREARAGAVLGAVVDQHQLQVVEALAEDAGNGGRQVVAAVAHRHQDRDQRPGGGHVRSRPAAAGRRR
jgi:hypothetical protein